MVGQFGLKASKRLYVKAVVSLNNGKMGTSEFSELGVSFTAILQSFIYED